MKRRTRRDTETFSSERGAVNLEELDDEQLDARKSMLETDGERHRALRRLTQGELSPWHGAFAAAAEEDTILHPVNAVGSVRWNAAFAYLDPARGRENLTVLAGTLVDRVLLDGDRAVGVATTAGELRA